MDLLGVDSRRRRGPGLDHDGRPALDIPRLGESFGLYGLVKKKAGLDPLTGLAAETLIASPFALAFLAARRAGALSFGGPDPVATLMLVFAGVVTAVPLLLFATAANRITLKRWASSSTCRRRCSSHWASSPRREA